MWQLLALLLTALSVLVLYLSNRHQGFLTKPLSKVWRLLAYAGLVLALLCWLQVYVLAAAFFMWLFVSSTAMVFIPLTSLLVKNTAQKNSQRNV